MNRDDEMLASAASRRNEITEKQTISVEHSPIRSVVSRRNGDVSQKEVGDVEMSVVHPPTARSPVPSSSGQARLTAHARTPQTHLPPISIAPLPPPPPPPPPSGAGEHRSPLVFPGSTSTRYTPKRAEDQVTVASSAFVTDRRPRDGRHAVENTRELGESSNTLGPRSLNPFDDLTEED